MAPAKRKAAAKTDPPPATPEKRQKKSVEATASSTRPSRSSIAAASAPRSTRSSVAVPSSTAKNGSAVTEKPAKANTSKQVTSKKPTSKTKSTKTPKKTLESMPEEKEPSSPRISIDIPQRHKTLSNAKKDDELELEEHDDGPSYWLMKAEPDSRIEKGKDVKFSIDDLKTATEPEGWDGVRNHVARNNMRLMMKGDLAFFYHSNCKVPGIVGTMEIVREHSTDETAFDAEHPYFDAKSDREKPKWCLVHVEFRQKFPEMVKLKELQKYAKDGGILEHMQVLNQARLSVSKVSKKEWDFIMGLVDVDDVAAASVEDKPKVGK